MSVTLEKNYEQQNTKELSALEIVRSFSSEPTSLTEVRQDERGNVFFAKDETQNPTGAYKWRGSAVKLSRLFAEETGRVVTASAGNHGQGIAWVSGKLGTSAEVFVPHGTPQSKLNGLQRLGAHIHLEGANFDEATNLALQFAKDYGNPFVHPFDDFDVMEGQGTIADELYEQMLHNGLYFEDTTIFVPVGGGGLIGGVAQRIKQLTGGRTQVVGVQVEGSDSAAVTFGSVNNCSLSNYEQYSRIYNPNYNLYYFPERIEAQEPNNDVDGTRVKLVGQKCIKQIVVNVDEFLVISPTLLGEYYLNNSATQLEPAGALAQVGSEVYSKLPGSSSRNFIAINSGRNQDPLRIQNLVNAASTSLAYS